MNNPERSAGFTRQQWLARLCPEGIPALWCPLLTHYNDAGAIDRARMAAHLRHLAPWIQGYLIPGSTGDGWELTDLESQQVLEFALEHAARLDLRVLVGVLKTEANDTHRGLLWTLDWLRRRVAASGEETGGAEVLSGILSQNRVCGFTVCSPRGSEISPEEIGQALESFLALGLPTVLYQLPQITKNEMSPALLANLADRFGNFILFKDSSGTDRVALSGKMPEGVFLTRGAEGDYVRWLAAGGGPYQGLLLSTANCVAHPLREMVTALAAHRRAEAQAISDRLTRTVQEVFALVSNLPDGNAFTNANKAMDHYFAFGPKAAGALPPRLHAGSRLPSEVIRATGEVLTRHGLMPTKGYLE